MKLSGLQPRVETVLFMTGVQKIVDVHHDEAEALAAFGRPPTQSGDVPSHVVGAAAAVRSVLGAKLAKASGSLDPELRRARGKTQPNRDGSTGQPPGL